MNIKNTERLQEIKESWTSEGHLVKIDREHFDWLIEQADRAETLAMKKELFKKEYMQTYKKYLQVLEQLQQAKKKIEVYEDLFTLEDVLTKLEAINKHWED